MPRISQLAVSGLFRRLANDGKRLRIVALRPNRDLAQMAALFEAGSVKPLVDGPYPFQAIRECLQRFGEGKHFGNIVVTMGG